MGNSWVAAHLHVLALEAQMWCMAALRPSLCRIWTYVSVGWELHFPIRSTWTAIFGFRDMDRNPGRQSRDLPIGKNRAASHRTSNVKVVYNNLRKINTTQKMKLNNVHLLCIFHILVFLLVLAIWGLLLFSEKHTFTQNSTSVYVLSKY